MVKIAINDKVTKLKERSKSKNTQDKYEGDWLKFIDYCKNKKWSNIDYSNHNKEPNFQAGIKLRIIPSIKKIDVTI